jgi:hypothetical protein
MADNKTTGTGVVPTTFCKCCITAMHLFGWAFGVGIGFWLWRL